MADNQEADTIQPNEDQQGPSGGLSLLARQTFGNQFHGEVKTDEAPTDDAEPQEPGADEAPQEAEAETDEAIDAEPVEAEAEAEAAPEGDEAEEVPISSLPELIENQEWDAEWFNSLKVPVKVDGTPAEAAISDLVANYQMNAAADKRLEDAKVKAQTQNQEFAEKSQAIEAQFDTAAKLVADAEALLDADVSVTNWDDLRTNDPAEYAAKKAEVEERRRTIEHAKTRHAEEREKAAQANQAEYQKQYAEYLAVEQSALLKAVPEWQDEKVANDEKAQLASFLLANGFSQEDVEGAADHRLIVMARKAMLFEKGQTKVAAAKKKVAKVPKVLKPGSPKPQEEISRENVSKAHRKVVNARTTRDQLKAGVEFLRAKRGG